MSKNAANRILGIADRVSTPPPSGLRAAKPKNPRWPASLPGDAVVLPDLSRRQLDTLDKTNVKAPNPMLLAISRGNLPKRPSRRTWFALGMVAGAALMWLAIGDVRPVYEIVRG